MREAARAGSKTMQNNSLGSRSSGEPGDFPTVVAGGATGGESCAPQLRAPGWRRSIATWDEAWTLPGRPGPAQATVTMPDQRWWKACTAEARSTGAAPSLSEEPPASLDRSPSPSNRRGSCTRLAASWCGSRATSGCADARTRGG